MQCKYVLGQAEVFIYGPPSNNISLVICKSPCHVIQITIRGYLNTQVNFTIHAIEKRNDDVRERRVERQIN